jgi:hypothetical protein
VRQANYAALSAQIAVIEPAVSQLNYKHEIEMSPGARDADPVKGPHTNLTRTMPLRGTLPVHSR